MMLNTFFVEPEEEFDEDLRQNASYVRKEFEVLPELESAKLITTACGIYVCYLNGRRIDNRCYLPGYTDYRIRLPYQTYDIKEQLSEGENAIGFIVGDGWYRGRVGLGDKPMFYGKRLKLLCFIELIYKDGVKVIITTDESWKATQNGPIRQNDLKGGEEYNACLEMSQWSETGFDDSAWHGCRKSYYDGVLIQEEGKRAVEQERFRPEIIRTPDGSTVLDFGQNMSGYVEFSVSGSAGTEVQLLFGETLDENGNFTLKNVRLESEETGEATGQVETYTLKEGKQRYKPIFMSCGFQYVKLVNWPENANRDNFEAIAVYSDIHMSGTFSCSNPLINRFVKNVCWSERSNFVEIPTDCPTRERAGWTGDVGIFAETACYLSDPRNVLIQWMNDFCLEQHKDGNLPIIVPDIGFRENTEGSAGWSDVIYIVPRELYRFYGDRSIIEKFYPHIRKWVEFNCERAKQRHPDNYDKNEDWWQFILDTGYHFGEWQEPGHLMSEDAANARLHPDSEVATAYFADSARTLSEMAGILGLKEDEARYASLFKNIREAYRKAFLPDGRVRSDRMCRYVRPVQMRLVTDEERMHIVSDLNKMVIANDYRIGTGFLTTPAILSVLTDAGYAETAFRLLENTDCPGWLYEVRKKATTVWENWYGKDDENSPKDSLNHYSPGSSVVWLFNTVLGIRPLKPGFEEISICPVPGGSLTYAVGEIDTPVGHISSAWRIEEGKFELDIVVPKDTIVTLPDGNREKVEAGEWSFSCEINEWQNNRIRKIS